MSPFRSKRGFRARGPRRGMEWVSAATVGTITLTAGSFSTNWIVLPSTARAYVNPTLVRTRGQVHLHTDDIAGEYYGAFGLIAWADRDDTVPDSNNVPRPYQDPDLDWIYHSYFHASSTLLTEVPVWAFGWTDGGPGQSVDSRAMRKLGADDGVLFVMENGSASSGSVETGYGFRCLIKE